MPLTIRDTTGTVRTLRVEEKKALYFLKEQYFKQKDNPDHFETTVRINKTNIKLRVTRSATEIGNPIEFQMQGYQDRSKYKTFQTPNEVDVYDRAKRCWRMATESEESGYYAMKNAFDALDQRSLEHKGHKFQIVLDDQNFKTNKDCVFCDGNFMVPFFEDWRLPTAFLGVGITMLGVKGCLVVCLRGTSKWMMPGGLVDSSDYSLLSAANRELFEESGIVLANEGVDLETAERAGNFFMLKECNIPMTSEIFDSRTHQNETSDFGVAYFDTETRLFKVLSSQGKISSSFRRGTPNQLKKFFGIPVFASDFVDRTIV